ncbi:MAG: 2-octaprenyl-6-methoxyphenyl hydroxylase [Gammaproteobacteria bacterium]
MNVSQTTVSVDYDVLIAGGGMVGASLAAALAALPLRIAVVEAVPFGRTGQPSYDERMTVLSLGSERLFRKLGLWPALASAATPIRTVHVSERGRFAKTRLHAAELGVEALGQVVPNRSIGAALIGFLSHQSRVELLAPAKVLAARLAPECVTATLSADGAREVSARLLVVADGAHSALREQLGIHAQSHDYRQNAVVCNVSLERPEPDTAFERFTEQGPIALLPRGGQDATLIWTLPRARIDAVLAWPEAEFLVAAAACFDGRFGRFLKMGQRQSYPLTQVRAESQWRGRALILGNAAHSLHPIAAQGFNLSLRDVARLAALIADALEQPGEFGDPVLLAHYVQSRSRDQTRTALFTDAVSRTFTNPLTSVGLARDSVLAALELLPAARRDFMRRSAGLTGVVTGLETISTPRA